MSSETDTTTYAPGFYPDAQNPALERYFDGQRWTEQVRPLVAVAPAAPVAKKPRNVIGLIALIAAIVGTIFAVIPGALIVGWILLPVAFILGLVSLFLPGKARGMGIAGLILSIVGTIIGFVAFFVVVGNAVDDALGDDTVAVAPGDTEDAADSDEQPAVAGAQDLAIVESAFGPDSGGMYWYAIIVDNPNADYIFDSVGMTVEAVAADGTIIDSSRNFVTLLQGRTIVTGTFLDVGSATIDRLEVRGPEAGDATRSPASETGTVTVGELTASTEYSLTKVSGTVSSTFASDQEYVAVNVIARDASGTIIGSTTTYIERLPTGGAAQFEAMFFDLANAASFEATPII